MSDRPPRTDPVDGPEGPGVLARARGVTYRYGSAAPSVERVDVVASRGRITAVVGPNGAGKSTLLRLMTGRLSPQAGRVERPPARRGDGVAALGYVGEATVHFDAVSGFRNAWFFARVCGLSRDEASRAVAEHVELLDLTEEAPEPVSTYSYGSRRKLLLVEALAHRPPLIVLDEPTAGLDASARRALLRLLRSRRADGAAVVLVSHDLDFVAELADGITFLHRGRVVAEGPPGALLSDVVGRSTRFEVELEERPREPVTSFGPDTVVVEDGDTLVLESSRGQAALPDVCAALVAAGARISGLAIREPGLAEVFRRITGEALEE